MTILIMKPHKIEKKIYGIGNTGVPDLGREEETP